MKLKAYAIRDSAVDAYLPPFFARADGEAIRHFNNACKTGPFKNLEVYYALFQIGTFDDNTGKLDAVLQPIQLITGLETIQFEER